MSNKLFIFNPTCEMAVANGQISYMPPEHLRKFENDLATLPRFFTDKGDSVITKNHTPESFINQQIELGFKLPSFIKSHDEFKNKTLPITELRPWGWSPAVHRIFKPYLPFCDKLWENHPMHRWQSNHKQLLSRETGVKLLSEIVDNGYDEFDLIEILIKPVRVSSLGDLKNITNIISPPTLLKLPWSASGRGLFKIRDKEEHPENNQWVKSKLKQQGFFYAEPFLNKIQDVSFHFWIGHDKVNYLGFNFFDTDSSGQFTGCHTHYPDNAELKTINLDAYLEQGSRLLTKSIKKLQIGQHYQGPLGVDAMLFYNNTGKIKLHPCIEVNLRHSMGLVNIKLRKYIHPERKGKWELLMLSRNEWKDKFSSETGKVNLQDGLIARGNLPLTPMPAEKGYSMCLAMKP